MYEPVLDRCVTTTIIKPSRLPTDDFSINDYGEYEEKTVLSPQPEETHRRQSNLANGQDRYEGKLFNLLNCCSIFSKQSKLV